MNGRAFSTRPVASHTSTTMKTMILAMVLCMVGCGASVYVDEAPCDAGLDAPADLPDASIQDAAADAAVCTRDGGPPPDDPLCHDIGGKVLPDGTPCVCGTCYAGECE